MWDVTLAVSMLRNPPTNPPARHHHFDQKGTERTGRQQKREAEGDEEHRSLLGEKRPDKNQDDGEACGAAAERRQNDSRVERDRTKPQMVQAAMQTRLLLHVGAHQLFLQIVRPIRHPCQSCRKDTEQSGEAREQKDRRQRDLDDVHDAFDRSDHHEIFLDADRAGHLRIARHGSR
jgi:hypothetical protein